MSLMALFGVVFASSSIQLVPDGTLLFHLAVIVVMVALLNRTLLRPINRILEERDLRTKGRLLEAEHTVQRVEEKMLEYESGLRQARAQAYSLMEQERTGASRERELMLALVREEIGGELAAETEKIRVEAQRVKGVLGADAQKLAVDISRQILHRPVDSQSVSQ
jgi:F0F1-type ATP synthase membrane subunit b/b'